MANRTEEDLRRENDVLRGLVQTNPEWKCPYGMQVETMGLCPLGFPGCNCADDRIAILCEHEDGIAERARAQVQQFLQEASGLRRMISCEETDRECAGTAPDRVDPETGELTLLSRCLQCQIAKVRGERDALQELVTQYGEVAGLSPLKYPKGRRLPDPDLKQDPAFLAHVLGKLEGETR